MNKKLSFLIPLIALFLSYCGSSPRNESDSTNQSEDSLTEISVHEQAFLNNLASLCGKSFQGRQVYMQPGRESWADKSLVMHVTVCEDTHVHIPFHIDDDQSRTWMFLVDEGKLRFRHDHRHEDGTPEDQTLYGGYSDGSGDSLKQYFPADEYTQELLTDTLSRQWNVLLNDDLSKFTYQLQYKGEIVFIAEFDLTTPL
jgi:hypothetical protein